MNKVILLGNVTRDPEVKYTPGGTAVANTGIATNKKFKKDGNTIEEVEFHDLTIWGASAEVWSNHVKKGQQMFIIGEIKTDKWEDDQGNKRSAVKIVVREFEFCGKKGGTDGGVSNSSSNSAPATQPANSGTQSDDDVPF